MGRVKIMGILNVTPDSFSDGGAYKTPAAAARYAITMVEAGADIIDVGGESTRPGANTVPVKQELARTVDVIKRIKDLLGKKPDLTAKISIDTRKPEVAKAAVKAGAEIWNDVSALSFSETSPEVAAKLGCEVILMHASGTPDIMQVSPAYEDVIGEIKLYLATRIAVAIGNGISREKITIDPGIGFGKRLEDNLAILRHLRSFEDLGQPILIGTSRKSFIGKIDGSDVDGRLAGSLSSALWAAQHGASIVRVHDVAETAQAFKVWNAIDKAK